MDIDVNDFFKPVEFPVDPTPKDLYNIASYIATVKAFERLCYQSLYVIDYHKRGFVYVSENPLFLCGEKPYVVEKLGYLFYLQHVPYNDLKMLLKINRKGFEFFENIAHKDRLSYSISYDFNLITTRDRKQLINHQLTPLSLDKVGNIWLALCVVSVSSNYNSGNVYIRKTNSNERFKLDLDKNCWIEERQKKLSNVEIDILLLSIKGFNINEIALKKCLAEATIKFHRKNICKKLDVNNMSEAIAFAVNNKII